MNWHSLFSMLTLTLLNYGKLYGKWHVSCVIVFYIKNGIDNINFQLEFGMRSELDDAS